MSDGLTHFVTFKGPDEPMGWEVEALFSFATPAVCGKRNWSTATDKPESVTCGACLEALKVAR